MIKTDHNKVLLAMPPKKAARQQHGPSTVTYPMIKFFRKIRQRLLAENRFSKYLLYAIGEIVLVVIGILIALQINNWNNARQKQLLEIKILKEISSNLTLDLDKMQGNISYMDSINVACTYLEDYMNAYDKPSDLFYKTASIVRVTPHFNPNKSGYGLLVSKGVETVSNDSLRNLISTHYEKWYPYYHSYEEERLRFHALHSEPKLLQYFKMKFNRNEVYYGDFLISEEDYMKLKYDAEFNKLLSAIAFENSAIQNRATRIEKSIILLLKALKDELVIKENL